MHALAYYSSFSANSVSEYLLERTASTLIFVAKFNAFNLGALGALAEQHLRLWLTDAADAAASCVQTPCAWLNEAAVTSAWRWRSAVSVSTADWTAAILSAAGAWPSGKASSTRRPGWRCHEMSLAISRASVRWVACERPGSSPGLLNQRAPLLRRDPFRAHDPQRPDLESCAAPQLGQQQIGRQMLAQICLRGYYHARRSPRPQGFSHPVQDLRHIFEETSHHPQDPAGLVAFRPGAVDRCKELRQRGQIDSVLIPGRRFQMRP